MRSYKAIIRYSKGKPVVNKDGMANVYIQYIHNRKAILIYTGIRTKPDLWDDTDPETGKKIEGRIKYPPLKGLSEKERKSIKEKVNSDNSIIDGFKSRIAVEVNSLVHQKIDPTVNRIKDILTKEKEEIKKNDDAKLIDLFKKYAAENQYNLTNGTLRHYRVTAGHVEKFLKKFRKSTILLSDVTFELVEDFKRFCIADLGLSNGSANNQIKRLKRFLQYSYDRGAYDALNFKKVKLYEYRIEDQKKIYLTKDEINRLYNYDFHTKASYPIMVPVLKGKTEVVNVSPETLTKARDLFILGCFTGLRFSDLEQLSPEHITKGFIELTTIKTHKPVHIPIILYAKDIIEKYSNGLPMISQQKMNMYIKEICRIVGIDDKIKLPTWRGKDRKDEIFSKYDLITSHTMKKSFVMLCVNEGIPVEVVASITGNSIKTLSHYYQIENDTKVKHLQKLVESFSPVMNVS